MTIARRLDRANMSVTGTPGTGAITLNAAVATYQTFAAAAAIQGVALAVNDVVWALATDGSSWEVWPAVVTGLGPTVLSAPDASIAGFSSSTGAVISLSSAATIANVDAAAWAPWPIVNGRLTPTTNMPVPTSDVTAATTLYWTPAKGAVVVVNNSVTWVPYAFAQLTLTLDTTNHLLGRVYDAYLYASSGALAIGLGPAWTYASTVTITNATPAVITWNAHGLPEGSPVVFSTSGSLPTGLTAGTVYYVAQSSTANTFRVATSQANVIAGTLVATSSAGSGTHTCTNATRVRGTGAGTTEIEFVDGIPVNKNTVQLTNGAGAGVSVGARKATYVGSAYMTANGTTSWTVSPAAANGGSAPILAIYNAHNQDLITLQSQDTTASVDYAYASLTWRGAKASSANRAYCLDGLGRSPVRTVNYGVVYSTNAPGAIGTSINSTTAAPNKSANGGPTAGASFIIDHLTADETIPALLGFNFYQRMEATNGASVNFSGAATGPVRQNNNFSVSLAA